MKLKTRKSIIKRIKMTKNGILLRRPSGQDHFRVRKNTKNKRFGRKMISVSPSDAKKILKALYF